MAKYKNPEKYGGAFLEVNLQKQIRLDPFARALSEIIGGMDLSLFDQNYHNDKAGAAAIPPAILLSIVIYCYSKGIVSSRKMERACKDFIIVKALANEIEPDHSTIAAFVSSNVQAINRVAVEVILKCGQLGLITGDMFAIDGCKLPSNASKEWSGTLASFRKKKEKLEKLLAKIIKQQEENDKSETKGALNKTCKECIEEKKKGERHRKRIAKKIKKIDAFLKITDGEGKESERKDKLGAAGQPINSNITDNESTTIKGPHGVIQGYNGIAIADSKSQVIVAGEAFGSGPEAEALPGMLDKLNEMMKEVTGKEEPLKGSLVEGDTGYFSEKNLEEAAKRGIEVLIPDQQFRKRDEQFADQKCHNHDEHFTIDDFHYNAENNTYTCPAGKTLTSKPGTTLRGKPMLKWEASIRDCKACALKDKCMKIRGNKRGPKKTILLLDRQGKENLSEKMKEKIDDPVWRQVYGERMRIIEPCFSNITYCKGMDRITLRGKGKANIQWTLFYTVHNIGKCVPALAAKWGRL
jgi:transposase